MPTKHPRSQITRTPEIQALLDQLKREKGQEIPLVSLVITGAQTELERIRSKQNAPLRKRLSDRIRSQSVKVDLHAATEVRRSGWARE